MDVALVGNSPSTMTAGIMLLTRARQLGFSLTVAILGDETDLKEVRGPAIVYAPVLASCGVGRDHGAGATVVIPGDPVEPLRVTVEPHGVGAWFTVDRTGVGEHPATQAFVRLSADARPPARELGKSLRRLLQTLGMSADTAVLDVLFGAPVPPLLRLALALRAGRSMTGGRGEPLTRFLAGGIDGTPDPLPPGQSPEEVVARLRDGELSWIYDRLATSVRDAVEHWVDQALDLAAADDGRDIALVAALVELASHLAQLPVHSILPPLGAAEDSVAVGLADALRAHGDGDANKQLVQVYRFLGGRFTDEALHPMVVSLTPAPVDTSDATAVWQWFCQEVRVGRKRADALWDEIFDPGN